MKYIGRPDGIGNRMGEIILCEAYCIRNNINGEYYWNNNTHRKDRKYPILFKTNNLLIHDKQYISESDSGPISVGFTLNEKINAAKNIKPLFNIKFENNIKPVGIHIRMGDKVDPSFDWECSISVDTVISFVNETANILNNSNTKHIFICSDNEKIITYLKSKLNKDIIVCNPICDNGVPEEYKDFFALSLCKELILSSTFSSYSICASLIGNININIFLPRSKMPIDAQDGQWLDAKYKQLNLDKQ